MIPSLWLFLEHFYRAYVSFRKRFLFQRKGFAEVAQTALSKKRRRKTSKRKVGGMVEHPTHISYEF